MLLTKPRKPMLMSLTAADLMTRNVVSIAENASLHEAVALMADRGYSGAPVINEAGRPVGVLTQSDVLTHDRNKVRYAKPVPEYYQRADLRSATGEDVAGFQVEAVDRTPVRDVMTPVVFSLRPDAPARLVIEEMLNLHVHRMFVVDDDGVLVGVIGTTDILKRLLD
ncbi:MAG: CBS domain-containing protein [Gemmataceae bacterium]